MSIERLFNVTAVVKRSTQTSDSKGGWTSGDPEAVGTLRGRLRSADGAGEAETLARQAGVRVSHVFYTDSDADVRRGDLLEIRGMKLDVRSLRRPSVPDHHLMVDLEERQT